MKVSKSYRETFERALVERVKTIFSNTVGGLCPQSINVRSFVDIIHDAVQYDVEITFLGQKSDMHVYTSYGDSLPATFWDHIKLALQRIPLMSRFPRFKPVMRQMIQHHHYHETRICPHINVAYPSDQHFVHIVRPLSKTEARQRIDEFNQNGDG
jgi:hypothetical protein